MWVLAKLTYGPLLSHYMFLAPPESLWVWCLASPVTLHTFVGLGMEGVGSLYSAFFGVFTMLKRACQGRDWKRVIGRPFTSFGMVRGRGSHLLFLCREMIQILGR